MRGGPPRWAIFELRREGLRTTLWLVPTVMVAAAAVLFVVTYAMDRAVDDHRLPGFVSSGSPDAARQVLIAIAAAVITVAGVLFSITMLVLQLASQQFGPRMLRNFIRDLGTQVSLGAFVATFAYCLLVLGSVQSAPAPEFVPHVSVTVALGLSLADLAVMIYFVHHVARSIQLTSVVSGIARDFRVTVAALGSVVDRGRRPGAGGEQLAAVVSRWVVAEGAPAQAQASGFIQALGRRRLMAVAIGLDAVICFVRRPGHFVVEGETVAYVLPASAAPGVSAALRQAHIVGPNRTLTQDPRFAIDQLVEVAIRALSPAVNDTFTALNCIDWLGDCLCHATSRGLPDGVHRDQSGQVRIVEGVISLEQLLKGATDKIRQAGAGMPAVLIRQLENLAKLRQLAPQLGEVIEVHAQLIAATAEDTIRVPADLVDVQAALKAALTA